MNALQIRGGRRLEGEWRVHSAKNAVLPIMAAAVMAEGTVTLHDVPQITDAAHMAENEALRAVIVPIGHSMNKLLQLLT